MRIAALTVLSLLAFAANSLLCRMALGSDSIDAATFATVRMSSGALALLLLTAATGRSSRGGGGNWLATLMLFVYMVAFSFAYVSLSTGTGALILFATVQVTMMGQALRRGERPHPLQWAGLLLALAGLVYLVLPGLTTPSMGGSLLMILAGFGWGVYSLSGRLSVDALADSTRHFTRAVPLVLLVNILFMGSTHISWQGASLAALSGAVASGMGYAVWYAALAGLTATRAAVVQLSVPVLAAVGGILFLGEETSIRLFTAMTLILGGVAIAIGGRSRPALSALARS